MLAAAVLAVALAGCVTPATLLRGPNLLYFLRMVAPTGFEPVFESRRAFTPIFRCYRAKRLQRIRLTQESCAVARARRSGPRLLAVADPLGRIALLRSGLSAGRLAARSRR